MRCGGSHWRRCKVSEFKLMTLDYCFHQRMTHLRNLPKLHILFEIVLPTVPFIVLSAKFPSATWKWFTLYFLFHIHWAYTNSWSLTLNCKDSYWLSSKLIDIYYGTLNYSHCMHYRCNTVGNSRAKLVYLNLESSMYTSVDTQSSDFRRSRLSEDEVSEISKESANEVEMSMRI